MLKSCKSWKNFCFYWWLILLSITNNIWCVAQLDAPVFEDFSQTILNTHIVNPSASDTSYIYVLRASNIIQLGLLKNVNKFYFDGDLRINSSRKNSFHFIGLQALNIKLGDYISKSSLQVRYSWFSQLSKKASFSSGATLGFVNYSFLTTSGGSGGSDYATDGSFGIHYLRPNTVIGISIQQIYPSVLIPVSQSFQLNRLYNIDIERKFNIRNHTVLTAYAIGQYLQEQRLLYSLGLMADVADLVMLGINNFSLRKSSFNCGVHGIRIFGNQLKMVVTYSFYHGSSSLPDSTLEFFVALYK